MSVNQSGYVANADRQTVAVGFGKHWKWWKRGARTGAAVLCSGLLFLPVAAADLSTVYALALRQDPVFEAARQALEMALEKLPQARAGLLPSVSANVNAGVQKGVASFSNAPHVERHVKTRNWALQLNQPLLKIGSWVAWQQADAQIRQAEAQFSLAGQDLILRVAQTCFDVLIAADNLTVAESQLTAVGQQLDLAKRNFEVGVSTVTDTYEAKARFDLARSQRIAAINDLQNKRAELEKITGEDIENLFGLKHDVTLPGPVPEDLQSWITAAREQSPLVRMQEAAQEVASKEIEKSRAEYYPSLDFTASYGRNSSTGSLASPADIETRARSSQVGLQLTIPLYSGGETASRVRAAAASYYKAKADWQAARRQAAASAKQAYTAVNSGQSQLEALRSAVESSRSSVAANQVGYRTGTRINIDVLNAEQQLASAQRDLTRTRYEVLVQGLKLKAATGQLSVADLVQIDNLLEMGASSVQSEDGADF